MEQEYHLGIYYVVFRVKLLLREELFIKNEFSIALKKFQK